MNMCALFSSQISLELDVESVTYVAITRKLSYIDHILTNTNTEVVQNTDNSVNYCASNPYRVIISTSQMCRKTTFVWQEVYVL